MHTVNLLDLDILEVIEWLDKIDTVFTDCDDVLWHQKTAYEHAPEVIAILQAVGKKVYLVTNNGTKTRLEIWQHAQSLGFNVAETDLITPNATIVDYLKQHNFDCNKKVYVIGNEAISRELTAVGIDSFGSGPDVIVGNLAQYMAKEFAVQNIAETGAVVVGWDEYFSYPKMIKACNILSDNNVHFLATNMDAVHKYPNAIVPGTGAFVRAVEACAGRKAIEMGKPNPDILAPLRATNQFKPERTLMIGDCCKIDMKFGKRVGMQTLLVGTGSYQLHTVTAMLENGVDNDFIPDFYLPKIGDMLPLIKRLPNDAHQ